MSIIPYFVLVPIYRWQCFFVHLSFFYSLLKVTVSKDKNPAFIASFLFACVATLIFVVVVFNRFTLLSYELKITWLQRFYSRIVKRMESPYSQVPENLATAFSTLSFSVGMLGRVISGMCEPDRPTVLYHNQGCNPQATVNEIPYASFFLMITVVLLCQALMKGSSLSAIIFS